MSEPPVTNDPKPKRDDPRGSQVGEMSARRETMADGRRYIVYYTFGDETTDAVDRKTEAPTEDV